MKPQLLGAPFINDSWVQKMRSLDIPHTNYRFACFTPTTSKFDSQTACGLQSHISLRKPQEYTEFDPVHLGVSLLWSAKHLYTVSNNDTGFGNTTTSFHWLFNGSQKSVYDVDVLSGGPFIREGIEAGLSPDEIRELWQDDLSNFRKKRESYLLY